MSIWNQSEDNNVFYTGTSIYHLTSEDGDYDGKIESKSDGTTHVYGTQSGWDDHSHDVYNSNGDLIYSRGEGYGHSWETRDDD